MEPHRLRPIELRRRRCAHVHQPARIRFLGGRDRNTAERSRCTVKNTSGGARGAEDEDADFLFTVVVVVVVLAGFRGAGGHSVGARSLLSSDVGVVGSAASAPASFPTTTSSFAAVVDDGADGVREDATAVLIGGSAGRTTSPAAAAAGELIWPAEFWVRVWGSRPQGRRVVECKGEEKARRVEKKKRTRARR
ncbi:hypothetical protein ABZP36_027082 [Zizania latifolia]